MGESNPTQEKLVLCPYCGHAQYGGDRCQDCGGLFEPLSRRATQIAMGPWYIRNKSNPFKPGCCYDIVKRMAETGKIKPTTVMRGPTTKQFWSIARNVPGVAHLVGYCQSCNAHVSPNEPKCPKCDALFGEPRGRNELGLAYKTEQEAHRAQRKLNAELSGEDPGQTPPMGAAAVDTNMPTAPSSDLLAEIMNITGGPGDSGELEGIPTPYAPVETAPPAAPVSAAASAAGYKGGAEPAAESMSVLPASGVVSPGTSAFEDIAPTGPIPSAGGIKPIVWVLVALNLIFISIVVVVIVLSR
ncbi:MAG: hypothetical protein AAGA29_11100 [Planctomycetota bacterium]